jgi:dihydrolipoamide dehydrogenase
VASIGVTEKEATAAGFSVRKVVFPLSANGKALTMGDSAGFVKILSDSRTNEIIGVHMVGAHVTEMIGGLSLAMRLETTAEELASVIFPHPTISESIVEAAHVLLGAGIHY